jgi:all-trans-retinol 13,14-reductase
MLAMGPGGCNIFANKKDKKKLPVVVIGGGLGGLSSAAYLAVNGFPVTLVEQHSRPGGYATSFERGVYEFEISLHATGSDKGGPMKRLYDDIGLTGKIQTAELPDMGRIVTPNSDIVLPQKKPDEATDKGIRSFMGEMMGILDEAMKPMDRDSLIDIILFPFTHSKMWGTRNKTLGDILDKHVTDSEVRSVLSYLWPYYGLPPSRLSSFYYTIATASYLKFGGFYIKKRSQDLSNTLMEIIESKGGRVLLGAEARSITMKDEKITGVTLSDGKTLKAEAVISNASVPGTMKMLAGKTDLKKHSSSARKYMEKLNTYRPSLSSFNVWLGLDHEIHKKIKSYETFISKTGDPEKDYEGYLSCNPKKSNIIVVIYDNAYVGYSKPGTSIVSILMLSGYEPWRKFEKDYLKGKKEAYYEQKNRITEELITEAERHLIPGLRSMIRVKEAGTPLTNLSYTMNPEGAIYGYEQSIDNSFINRIKCTTPFEGLYLASAWGGMGGGYQPCLGSGRSAFRELMKEWGFL